jgi:molybdopterin synthase sulfur carrier subunit
MSKVKIKLFANLREIVGVKEEFVEAQSVGEALEKLVEKHSALKDKIFPQGELNKSLNIMLNGKNTDLNTEVREGDEIAIFPPVAGG